MTDTGTECRLLQLRAGKLGHALPLRRIVVHARQDHVWLKFGFRHLEKTHVLLAGKAYVDVVIPRDETLVTHRSEQRAADQEIRDTVFLADAVKFFEQRQLDELEMPQITYCLFCFQGLSVCRMVRAIGHDVRIRFAHRLAFQCRHECSFVLERRSRRAS